MNLLFTASNPFAIITAVGNSKNKSSVPFLFGINKEKNTATMKWIIKRIQLFLNELFTENAFGDFKKMDITESAKMSPTIQ
nr:tRNA (guanine-N7)-methyltransferase [uncultured Polaribacter sp.]